MPTDNPFYDGAGPNVDSIWARGLRNPFRAYYDAPTGRYFIGDVGGNDYRDRQGGDQPRRSGRQLRLARQRGPLLGARAPARCTPTRTTAATPRSPAASSTTAPSSRASYRGAYFYADYAQNWIRGLTFDANGAVTGTFNFEPADGTVDGPYGDIVYLAEGPDGALYYVDLGYSDVGGTFGVSKIRRISYVQSQPGAGRRAPRRTPTSGPTPLDVDFSSAGSSDPEGAAADLLVDFGDGTTSTAANPTHTYAQPGPYQARLTVSDGVNNSISTPITISAGSVPTATILHADRRMRSSGPAT